MQIHPVPRLHLLHPETLRFRGLRWQPEWSCSGLFKKRVLKSPEVETATKETAIALVTEHTTLHTTFPRAHALGAAIGPITRAHATQSFGAAKGCADIFLVD